MKLGAAMLVMGLALFQGGPARAETPEEWVKLGARIHGGFGALIPIGIRIGLDARERLRVGPRELSVLYYSGEGASRSDGARSPSQPQDRRIKHTR
jgi:hypothetical protein